MVSYYMEGNVGFIGRGRFGRKVTAAVAYDYIFRTHVQIP